MKQIQKTATHVKREVEEPAPPVSSEKADAVKADLDDVLDEIDAVLEENAQEFVDGFIQKGGQ